MSLRFSWHLLLLGLVAAGVVLAGVLELGPPSSSARTSREVVTAAKGVVQSTVTGSGNVEPGTDVEANFQTSGTLAHLYAKTGDHVVNGQLLATLDPTAAQNTLNQAEANLTSAEDQLTNAENATVTTTTSRPVAASAVQYVALHPTQTTTTATTPAATTTASSTTTTSTTPTTTTTTPTPTTTTTTTSQGSGATGSSSGASQSPGSSGSSSASGASTSGETAATKAANIASAQASIDGAEASVTTAETALHETHCYAPATGTVVSVQSISPGDQVSGSSSSSASSSNASGASSGTATTSSGSLGSTSSSSNSSSGLAEIINTAKMTMTVAFSESDISKIKVGQPATVTLEALTGVELAAHVTSISTLGTTSSSVVSYNATLTLDQHDARVKPGMSASAAVITGQASGVTLPSSAVTGSSSVSTVNELRNGKSVPTPVVVGLRGDSRTQIVSGLSAGTQVVVTTSLPSLSSSASSSSPTSGTLGGGTTSRRFGAGGFGGAGGAIAGGAGGGPGG